MKTKLMKSAFVAAIAMAAGINVFNSQKLEEPLDIVRANVEALADGEGQIGSTCYEGYSSCWFWNCMNYFICEKGCPSKSVDAIDLESTCR